MLVFTKPYKVYKTLTLILCIAIFTCGCNKGFPDTGKFNDWLNNKDNGCYVEKNVAGITVGVKYLPPAYKALQAIELNKKLKKQANVDSLMLLAGNEISFVMTLSPSSDRKIEKGDAAPNVMYEGVANYSEFSERVTTMNFFMDQYIKMYIGKDSVKPAMVLVENVYELSERRLFNIVFAVDKKHNSDEYIVVYSDPYFGMGDLQFPFKKEDIDKANNLIIKNKEL